MATVAVVDAKAPYYLGDGSKYLRVRTGNLVHLTLSPNRVSTMFRCVSTTCASLRASSPVGDIVKSRPARGTREETLSPSRLRRSLSRSRAARFARPHKRACSQAGLVPPRAVAAHTVPNSFSWHHEKLSSLV